MNLINNKKYWEDIAPHITRQRLIIEGTTTDIAKPNEISNYLKELSKISNMKMLREPFVYSAHEDGFGAWIHWKTSGATFYSYPKREGNNALFTLDTYTCKAFSVNQVVEFTKEYFKPVKIVWKEVT